MENEFKIAQKVATLVESIEVIDDKLSQIAGFATTILENDINHLDLSLEECDIDNPPNVQYLYPQVNKEDIQPGQEVMPVGYQKTFVGGKGNISIYSSVIPKDICLAVVDTMVERLQAEKLGYQSQLSKIFPKSPKEKTYTYTVDTKNPEN